MPIERSELTWGTGERGLEPSAREPELSVRQHEGLAAACGLVGDRWSLPIVAALLDGPLRYTEI
ncbi:MAG TPA: hypothetical protein VH115_01975, partial [Solirubrobacteraceae bacterium]|nr:hypothetical protein [Solirubrobacteraceae bacterium]